MGENLHSSLLGSLLHTLLPCKNQHGQHAPAWTTWDARNSQGISPCVYIKKILAVKMFFHIYDIHIRNWWNFSLPSERESRWASFKSRECVRKTFFVANFSRWDCEECKKFKLKFYFLVVNIKLYFQTKKERTYFI